MRKIGCVSLMLLSFLLVLSACGNKAAVGMNVISLKELEKKLDNDESFLLVTLSASEEDVEKSVLREACNDDCTEKDKNAINVNFDGERQETLETLGGKYTP